MYDTPMKQTESTSKKNVLSVIAAQLPSESFKYLHQKTQEASEGAEIAGGGSSRRKRMSIHLESSSSAP